MINDKRGVILRNEKSCHFSQSLRFQRPPKSDSPARVAAQARPIVQVKCVII
jgi:hypothetical protein